jgi:hypothetical protein
MRIRTDPAVCVTILRLFYHYGRGNEQVVQPTKNWINQILRNRAYLGGTRYHSSPDVFLFYLSKLLQENPTSDVHKDNASLLCSRLKERINTEGDAMEVAMRVLACQSLRIDAQWDLKKLIDLQFEDGGWPTGWLCRLGKSGLQIGSRGISTALAITAIENGRKNQSRFESTIIGSGVSEKDPSSSVNT